MTRVGVVAALPAEALAFGGRRKPTDAILDLGDALLACSGTGPERAQKRARALVERGVGGLVSWGTAGGLDPTLRAGDLLLPKIVHTASDKSWTCDDPWRSRLERTMAPAMSVRVGDQFMNDVVVARSADKARLARTGALAVDMESAAVGAVAASAGLPFVVVRAVCDGAQRSLPRGALIAIDATGRFRPGPLAGYLLRRPLEVLALLALRRDLHAALRTLRQVVQTTGCGLAFTREP